MKVLVSAASRHGASAEIARAIGDVLSSAGIEADVRRPEEVTTVAVWLFSSGPIGDPAKPQGEPVDVAALRESTHAIDHRVFAGKLERRQLGLAEKAIVAVVHAAEGDYRQWDAVTEWASSIAETLRAREAV